jgi:DNA transformation protein and related proteins
MAISPEFQEFLHDQLALFGPIGIRRMFGGAGVFRDGLMFGLVVDETLYLKAGDTNREDFERAGLKPFTYMRKSKPASLGYYEVPPDVLEDPQEMRDWAEKAFAVALIAARAKPSKRRRGKAAS